MKLPKAVAVLVVIMVAIAAIAIWFTHSRSTTIVGSVGETVCINAGPECNQPNLVTDEGVMWELRASDSKAKKILEYRDKRIKVRGRVIDDRKLKVVSFEVVQ